MNEQKFIPLSDYKEYPPEEMVKRSKECDANVSYLKGDVKINGDRKNSMKI